MSPDMEAKLRVLPAVDRLLQEPRLKALALPRSVVKAAVQEVLDRARAELKAGRAEPPGFEELLLHAVDAAKTMDRPALRRVINATGVVLHTNLGRAPLAEAALKAVTELARTYSNLEFDLTQGRRGSRYSLVVGLLQELTGAEAALVVNNNAAAVLVALNALALGREVVVSRGQLVEIGGSFRIPEVMARSGAVLVEVGATNKTHLRDYEAAVTDRTAGLLKVHQSNFAMVGFHQVVPLADLAGLARAKGLWVMEDLGSGCLLDLSLFGLPKEPTVAESLAAGADLVTFSGDKLLGGPQAGLIVGRAELVGQVQRNPLNRAVRIDKLTLAGLEATLRLYRDRPQALSQIPTLKLLTLPEAQLARRAAGLRARLLRAAGGVQPGRARVLLVRGSSQVGGGSLPLANLPTRLVGLSLAGWSAGRLEEAFRGWPTPIVGRIERDLFLLDPRTLLPGDAAEIVRAFRAILAGGPV